MKMDENPGFIQRQLMKIDMGVFYWIMRTFKAGIALIDVLLDNFLGYTIQHGTREERTKSEKYEYSAQIVKLLGRGAYSPLQPHQLNNFVWRHEKYVHPKYVLDHDNITLMSVTPSHVFFCISDQNLDIFDTQVTTRLELTKLVHVVAMVPTASLQITPFLFITQFLKAEKLLIMRQSSFNRLGAEVGDPMHPKVVGNRNRFLAGTPKPK